MKKQAGWIAVGVAMSIGVVFAQIRPSPSETKPQTYRVTSWPAHADADEKYVDEVETYLNKMVSDGWRFHSEMVAQGVRMMVFERIARP